MVTIASKKDADNRDATTKRLDVIIRLLMEVQREPEKKITKNDQLLILDSMDLGVSEIGKIVGWSTTDIGSQLAKLKKAKKK